MSFMQYSEQMEQAAAHWSGGYGAPNEWSRQHPDGVSMYRNTLIENVFAKAHPITPGVWFGPVVAYGLYRGFTALSPWAAVALFVFGGLLWTLAEYLLHRFPMHRVIGPEQKKLPYFLLHGYHHEFPSDPMRLVAPLPASWTGALIVGTVYYLLLGPHVSWPLLAGTCAGYVAYDWIHYYTHHFRPKTRVGKYLRRYHMEHHFKDHDTHYGISSPLWDYVFGTVSRRRGKQDTEPVVS